MVLTKELTDKMKAFKEKFNDIVPLFQLPANVTQEELIAAIDRSIEEEKNLLPEIFGYGNLEKDKDKLI